MKEFLQLVALLIGLYLLLVGELRIGLGILILPGALNLVK